MKRIIILNDRDFEIDIDATATFLNDQFSIDENRLILLHSFLERAFQVFKNNSIEIVLHVLNNPNIYLNEKFYLMMVLGAVFRKKEQIPSKPSFQRRYSM